MVDSKKQSNPILVILCALGLIAFLLLAIYPNYRTLCEYDRRISALKGEIALRQALAPIYGKLIEKARIAPSIQLKSPEKKGLDLEDTGRLTQIFQDIAIASGLMLKSVIPDAQAFVRNDRCLLVDVVFCGDFMNVQPLINTIAEQPFVDRVQKFRVRTAQEDKRIRLTVSLLHR